MHTKLKVTDYSIYFISIGRESYQLFIKNLSADSDFIKIVIGITEMMHGERKSKIIRSLIISPLQPGGDQIFIQELSKSWMKGRRFWVAFEARKRIGRKNISVGSFLALSPNTSKWRKTIGSATLFELRSIDSIKSIEGTPMLDNNQQIP